MLTRFLSIDLITYLNLHRSIPFDANKIYLKLLNYRGFASLWPEIVEGLVNNSHSSYISILSMFLQPPASIQDGPEPQ